MSIHNTKNYEVIVTQSPEKDSIQQLYGVRNKNTQVIELYYPSLDRALVGATLMDYIIENQIWRKEVEDYMAGNPPLVPVAEVDRFNQ